MDHPTRIPLLVSVTTPGGKSHQSRRRAEATLLGVAAAMARAMAADLTRVLFRLSPTVVLGKVELTARVDDAPRELFEDVDMGGGFPSRAAERRALRAVRASQRIARVWLPTGPWMRLRLASTLMSGPWHDDRFFQGADGRACVALSSNRLVGRGGAR